MIDDSIEEKFSKVHSLAYELKVEDVYVKNLVTIGPDATMEDLKEMLRQKKISGIPVVNGEKMVGIISIEDLIRCLVEGKIGEPVSNWMNKEVKSVYSDEILMQAIMKFSKQGFGRFPVIERESDRLLGILTKGNIIKGLLHKLQSSYLEEEIHKIRASHIFEDLLADEMILKFKYKVVGKDFRKAGKASTNFKKSLSRLGIPSAVLQRVSIATYEAEINVVSYTEGGIILATVKPSKITVVVSDRGPGIPDIELAMKPGYSTAPEWVRELGFGAGMGLCNIKKCSDEMKLVSEVGRGTILKFIVNLNQSEGK
ncbi:MAG: CBS domain-containing protein [Candidatus Eremiobacteraeota bacterium]|nr:CBS domain-containing protein [Candidatus Eremiobacteraeota bacterium]